MALVDFNRDIRSSVRKRVEDLFTAPPVGTGLADYTVYNEAGLRGVMERTLTPARPCVFVVSIPIRPVETALPMVSIEVLIRTRPFELGNRKGRYFQADLHIFGRQKNEVSMIASFLQDQIRPLGIYSFVEPDYPAFRENALVQDEIDSRNGGSNLGDDLRQQGAFDNYLIVSLRAWTRDV